MLKLKPNLAIKVSEKRIKVSVYEGQGIFSGQSSHGVVWNSEGLRNLLLQEGEAELLIAKTVITELAAHGIQVFLETKVCH